jgi:predicted Zn-dependent protease
LSKCNPFQRIFGHHRHRAAMKRKPVKRFLHALAFVGGFVGPLVALTAAAGAQGISLLQDTETERLIRSYEDPILKVAGIDPKAVSLYLVNDIELNAFVAEGQNIFVNAGLFIQLQSPNELVGVMAHETGHMAGGHLSRGSEAMEKATIPMILSMIVGVGAMIAGAGEAGMVLMGIGQGAAEAQYFSFSRAQEATADQMGQRYLRLTHQSGMGMVHVFNRMANDLARMTKHPDRFVSSHPADRDRVTMLLEQANASPYRDVPDPPASVHAFRMVKAKVIGYLLPVKEVLDRYPVSDTGPEARYARAMMYLRKPDLAKALSEIQSLIRDEPNNPYFYEVLGQTYVSMGQPEKGAEPYRKAVFLMPDAPEIRISLAATLIATEKRTEEAVAIGHLKIALQQDREQPYAWYELAQAYSDIGNEPMANLATAELKYYSGDVQQAAVFAMRARQALPQGSPDWQHANDILAMVQPLLQKR